MAASTDTRRDAGPIRADGLSIAYGSGSHTTQVLADVTLHLTPGTITGLAGESGSGKSTLALALMGYRPGGQRVRSGAVQLDGTRITGASVRALRKLWGTRPAYMPQDTSTSLNPALTVGAHFTEVLAGHGRGHRRAAAHRAAAWLGRVDVPEPQQALRRYPHQFSGGQQQRIALALALCLEPEVLILDEPTTGLDVVTQAQVNRLIVALARDTGVAALYVSHNLALLATVCDDLAIMYAGQLVEHGPVDRVYRTPRHPYTSALISAVPSLSATAPPRGIPGLARTSAAVGECGFLDRCPLRVDACAAPIPLVEVSEGHVARCIRSAEVPPPGGGATGIAAVREPAAPAALLTVTDLTCQFRRRGGSAPLRAVDGVSVTVTAGRTLGIAGESGSGKSTLLKAMAGLIRPTGGRMSFHDTELVGLAANRPMAVRKAIQIVFQNPDATLNPRHTIGQSLERPLRLFAPRTGRAERQRLIAAMMQRVHLSPVLLGRYPRDLSGGQRQRVAIARSLLAEPEVLLCDEVTSALDVSVQASIIELLIELRDEHRLALVFVTHDLGVLRSIADDAVIMQNGQLRETGPVAQVLAHPVDPYTIRLVDAVPDPDAGGPADRASD
jgi:peptide/nickel transport system ATP-binding protein